LIDTVGELLNSMLDLSARTETPVGTRVTKIDTHPPSLATCNPTEAYSPAFATVAPFVAVTSACQLVE
jgi:hypothetical protein